MAFAISANAQALVIDSFGLDQGPYTDSTPGGGSEKTITGGVGGEIVSLSSLDVIGGARDLWTSMISGSGMSTVEVSAGTLNFSTTAGTVGRAQVQWDGFDGSSAIDATGLGGIDFLFGGSDMSLHVSTNAGFLLELSLYTDATRWTTVSRMTTAGSASYLFPFADFNTPTLCGMGSVTCGTVGGVETSNVGAVVLDINRLSTAGLEASIGPLSVVPEPEMLYLFGIGMLAALVRHRPRPRGRAAGSIGSEPLGFTNQ
jgi:hypothetical protein